MLYLKSQKKTQNRALEKKEGILIWEPCYYEKKRVIASVFNTLDKTKHIFLFVGRWRRSGHKLWDISPTTFVGPAAALPTVDPLVPILILVAATRAEQTQSPQQQYHWSLRTQWYSTEIWTVLTADLQWLQHTHLPHSTVNSVVAPFLKSNSCKLQQNISLRTRRIPSYLVDANKSCPHEMTTKTQRIPFDVFTRRTRTRHQPKRKDTPISYVSGQLEMKEPIKLEECFTVSPFENVFLWNPMRSYIDPFHRNAYNTVLVRLQQ